MSEERRIRLNQAAREFKVGVGTIVDFLAKKGINVDNSPNAIIGSDAYGTLEKEFGSNRGDSRANMRERINIRQETISLDSKKDEPEKRTEVDFKDEVLIKTSVINVKDEVVVRGPKVLGKIDLTPKPRKPEQTKEVPKPEHTKEALKPELTKEVLKEEQTKEVLKEESKAMPKVVEPLKIEPKQSVKQTKEIRKEPTPPIVKESIPPVEKKATPLVVEESTQPIIKKVQPEPIVQTKTYDERKAADTSDVFRPETNSSVLSGPKVLGKMDIQNIDHGKREKRKRITKDKVDVTKQQPGQQRQGQGQGQRQGQGQGQRPGQPGAKGGFGHGGGKPQTQQGGAKKGVKGKNVPRPVLRPEVSDEAVQRQVKDTLARLTAKGGKNKSAKYRRDKRDNVAARMSEEMERAQMGEKTIQATEFVTVSELATMMNANVNEVIMACMNLGLMVSINQRLDAEALVVVAEEFGYKVEFVSVEIQEAFNEDDTNAPEDLVSRPPIVTVMGHVDHGKTSLLDNIRKANVIAGEAGGITQHIGAYSVELDGKKITFLDTPGHEAFTAMRARGASVTDVAIIIIAADDSVMPQTIEAINHAAAAGVPMVFAINKIDKDGANSERIKEQLAGMNYLVEDWGGKYQSQEVSARQGLNLDKLLEKVLLEAEFLDLKANPEKKATGAVIESSLDKGRGYVSTILVQNGTLRVGDILLAGTYTGRVKAMFDENGQKLDVAPPATPVLVLGLNGAPQAGDTFNVMEDDKSARDLANKREQLQRMQDQRTQKHVTLDEIGRRIAIGNFKELNIIVKGDVDGSVEAMTDSLIKLSKEEVQVNVIHKAVGQISESDVILAAASNAIIVAFQVRPSTATRKLAEKEEIEIRLYSIIYDAINDIKDAIEGMLAPIMKEEIVCSVEVLETFKITKVGTIAGCIVREGRITRNTPIRIIRDGIVVYTGKLGSLKRFKDDMKEVTNGMECGLNIDNYNDIKVGDIVEGYEISEVKR